MNSLATDPRITYDVPGVIAPWLVEKDDKTSTWTDIILSHPDVERETYYEDMQGHLNRVFGSASQADRYIYERFFSGLRKHASLGMKPIDSAVHDAVLDLGRHHWIGEDETLQKIALDDFGPALFMYLGTPDNRKGIVAKYGKGIPFQSPVPIHDLLNEQVEEPTSYEASGGFSTVWLDIAIDEGILSNKLHLERDTIKQLFLDVFDSPQQAEEFFYRFVVSQGGSRPISAETFLGIGLPTLGAVIAAKISRGIEVSNTAHNGSLKDYFTRLALVACWSDAGWSIMDIDVTEPDFDIMAVGRYLHEHVNVDTSIAMMRAGIDYDLWRKMQLTDDQA
jgi:hypothetical protein